MNVLAIDTSSRFLSVTLKRDDERVFEYVSQSSLSHNEEMTRSCQSVLEESEVALKDISKIVLGAGPGSFTGLRIGFCFTQGLSVALSVPVLPLPSSLGAAFLFASQACESTVIVLAKANKNEVYVSRYTFRDGTFQWRERPTTLLEYASLQEYISGEDAKGEYFVTTDEEVLIALQNMHAPANTQLVTHLATGLLRASEAPECAALWHARSAGELSKLTPDYVQRVAAKTIVERQTSNTT